jgi:uncharacterized protein (TIGR03066 family)
MRKILMGLVAIPLALSISAGADEKQTEKIEAAKLVGKWEPLNGPKGEKIVLEFTKEGKTKITFESDPKRVREGSYKVDGNKLTLSQIEDGKEESETATVTKLTDTELVTEAKGTKATFKRIKADK